MAIRQHFDLLASILLILFLQLRWTSEAREDDASSCLDQLQFPCSRLTLPGQRRVGILCSNGQSLQHLLSALKPLQHCAEPIDMLRLEDTPIPVLYLDSHHGLISSLPIRHLIIRNCSLSHLRLQSAAASHSGDPAIILESVEQLELSQNEIANLTDCPALAAFRALRSLSLSANRLTAIPKHTFLHFHSRRALKQLDLSANLLSEHGLPAEAFLGLEHLQRLSLDKNQLSRVPTETVAQLADSLEELYVSANQIDRLDAGDVPPLPRLKSLGLDVNQISWLNGDALRSVPSLWYLYLGQNQFSAIPPEMLAFLPELRVLAMAGNPVDSLDAQTFQMAASLLRLDLSQCRIRQIHADTFAPVPRLQFLHLAGNRLDGIPSELFAGKLPFLVGLDLARNELSHIGEMAFAGLSQLQSLNLSGNRLASLGPQVFRDTFPQPSANFQMLDLTENPVDCGADRIGWLLALRGRVRLKGKCAAPEQLRHVPLAEFGQSTDSSSRELSGELVERKTAMIITSKFIRTTTTAIGPSQSAGSGEEAAIGGSEIGRRQAQPKAIGGTTSGPDIISTTKGRATISGGTELSSNGRTTEPTLIGGESGAQERRRNIPPPALVDSSSSSRESSAAVLVLVLALTGVGLILLCLLLVSRALFRHGSGQVSAYARQNSIGGDGWLRLKLFGPSKSFSPPPAVSHSMMTHKLSAVGPAPARLTTLSRLHQPNAIFYTGPERGTTPPPLPGRDRWRIQKETFRF